MRTTFLIVFSLFIFACDSDDDSGSNADTGTMMDSGSHSDSGSEDAATADTATDTTTSDSATEDAAATFELQVENYLSWCSISIDGGAESTTERQAFSFPAGTVVDLSGDLANSTFVWGYWYGTDGDTTADHDTNHDTTVTMDSDKLIQACCPFASDPNTPCPEPTAE